MKLRPKDERLICAIFKLCVRSNGVVDSFCDPQLSNRSTKHSRWYDMSSRWVEAPGLSIRAHIAISYFFDLYWIFFGATQCKPIVQRICSTHEMVLLSAWQQVVCAWESRNWTPALCDTRQPDAEDVACVGCFRSFKEDDRCFRKCTVLWFQLWYKAVELPRHHQWIGIQIAASKSYAVTCCPDMLLFSPTRYVFVSANRAKKAQYACWIFWYLALCFGNLPFTFVVSMDIDGLMFTACARLHPDALICCAPPCSLFSAASQSVHQRCVERPEGNLRNFKVRLANRIWSNMVTWNELHHA